MIIYHKDIPGTPQAIGPYSVATEAGGIVFLSGQIPLDPATGQLVNGDVSAQTNRVLANIGAALSGLGLTTAQLAKSTIFLTDMNDFKAVNELYEKFLGSARPARSTVQVAALPRGAKVEIECIAVRG